MSASMTTATTKFGEGMVTHILCNNVQDEHITSCTLFTVAQHVQPVSNNILKISFYQLKQQVFFIQKVQNPKQYFQGI